MNRGGWANTNFNTYKTGDMILLKTGIYPGRGWLKNNTITDMRKYSQLKNAVYQGDAVLWDTQTIGFGANTIANIAYGNAYGNGVWVVAGGSALSVSTDLINWNTRSLNVTSISSIAYGNGVWVLAANGNQIFTSTDTVNWNTQTSRFAGFSSPAINSVCYGDGVWVAVGEVQEARNTPLVGLIRTSTDTINWNTRSNATSPLKAVNYGNGVWVAVGSNSSAGGANSVIRTSTDTINWNTRSSNYGVSSIYYLSSISYGNNLWVAGGSAGVLGAGTFPLGIRTSTDTINWNTQSTMATDKIYSVAYGNNQWILSIDGSEYFRISTDIVNWNTRTSTLPAGSSPFSFYTNGVWLAGSSNGSLRTSWVYGLSPNIQNVPANHIAWVKT